MQAEENANGSAYSWYAPLGSLLLFCFTAQNFKLISILCVDKSVKEEVSRTPILKAPPPVAAESTTGMHDCVHYRTLSIAFCKSRSLFLSRSCEKGGFGREICHCQWYAGLKAVLVVLFLYFLPQIPVYSTELDACLEEVGPLKPKKSVLGTLCVVL